VPQCRVVFPGGERENTRLVVVCDRRRMKGTVASGGGNGGLANLSAKLKRGTPDGRDCNSGKPDRLTEAGGKGMSLH
jgi:hypothetical protein